MVTIPTEGRKDNPFGKQHLAPAPGGAVEWDAVSAVEGCSLFAGQAPIAYLLRPLLGSPEDLSRQIVSAREVPLNRGS